jgi:alkyldihydroxyacetonephosphate synthase
MRLEPSALPAGARAALEAVAAVRDDPRTRVEHAAGKGLPDLLRLRAGQATPAPDAVVAPASHDAVRAVLSACAEHRVAVVPFGGGTSVVGGVEPLRGHCDAVVALDLAALDGVEVDGRSLLGVVGAGLPLPELEQRLAGHGMTLGHFPQSYEYATIGGCVATRSAGQASTGYGRIDKLVRGVTLAAPAGDLAPPALPASAAGPDLRQLIVGSEGALGVITSAALQLHPKPRTVRYEGLVFGSFVEGREAFRRCVQAGVAGDISRLSDEDETRLTLALAGRGRAARALAAYLRVRRMSTPCLVVVGWEGTADDVSRRRRRTISLLRKAGGVSLGQRPGNAWMLGRYSGPYLRDDLLDRGVLVETLETAHTWSGLEGLYGAVRQALQAHAPLVGCHVSHLYETGASLYFTFLMPARAGEELEQWRAAKTAASEAIVGAGGTITHHHAIGRDHVPWLPREDGELGVDVLLAAKERLDPAGIMNPGKLLPPATE